MKYFVYVYLDPRKRGKFIYSSLTFESEPIYVGKGCYSRDLVHLEKCKHVKPGTYPFYDKLNKIINDGYVPDIIRIFSYEEEKEALNSEKETISLIGRKNLGTGPLLNLTEGGIGGDTFSGQTDERKEEIRKKWSISYKGKNLGKKCSDEQKEKLRTANLGKKASTETKTKMSNTRRGRKFQTVICPYCNKSGGITGMKRHHFEKCRNKNNEYE